MQISGGLRYIQPDTNWRSTPWASFDRIVDEVIAHRQSNPHLITTNGWSVERRIVENEVDEYNARICAAMGWTQWLQEGAVAGPQSGPFLRGHPQTLLHSAKNVAAGSSIIIEWIQSGAEAVPIAQATKRASICAGVMEDGSDRCPKNVNHDLTSIFTIPVSHAIRSELKRRKDMNLETPYDEKLGVCSACSCPMKLKVHVPLNSFLHKMSGDAVADLDPRCWITAERDGREPVIKAIQEARDGTK